MNQRDRIIEALLDHEDFWNKWLSARTGPMADFFAPDPQEQDAARDLALALSDEEE